MRTSLGSGVRYEIHGAAGEWTIQRDGERLATLETKRAAFEEVAQAVSRALSHPEKIVIVIDGEAVDETSR